MRYVVAIFFVSLFGSCKSRDYNAAAANVSFANSNSTASIIFPFGGSPKVRGVLRAAQPIRIEHEYRRLISISRDACVQTMQKDDLKPGEAPYRVMQVQMNYQVNDDPTVHRVRFVSGYAETENSFVPLRNVLIPPRDARQIQLWFSCGGEDHTFFSDDNFGVKFVFDVLKDNSGLFQAESRVIP